MDNYIFKVEILDTGCEFSENFNAKDEIEVKNFEQAIKDVLENQSYYVGEIKLMKVTVEL